MKFITFGIVLCALPLGAWAAPSAATGNVTAEQAFVTKAAQAGLAEVEMGKLAQTRSSNAEVKKFAAQMVKEHQTANDDLAALARQKNLTVPTQLNGANATLMHRLSAKPASEFDSEYGKQMVRAHEEAVTLFSDAAALRDADLVAFAKKALDTVQHHQRLAAALPSKTERTPDAITNAIPPPAAMEADTAAGKY